MKSLTLLLMLQLLLESSRDHKLNRMSCMVFSFHNINMSKKLKLLNRILNIVILVSIFCLLKQVDLNHDVTDINEDALTHTNTNSNPLI